MKEDLVMNYLAVSPEEYKRNVLNETFKGEVEDIPVRFPKGLGAEHPFNFDLIDKILDNVGIANALVDKIVDAIIGDFTVKVDNPNSQALLDSFIDESSFKSKIRPWIKEGVSKGNGFMEIDLFDKKNISRLRVMKANSMYVKRNNKSKVMEYNQYKGRLKNFLSSSKVINFKPNEIAHLTINKTPNDPYGKGLVWCNRVTIENYACSEVDRIKLLSRKAGAPIHVKLGQPGQGVRAGDIDKFKADLQYMNNSTEWVTDSNVDIKLIDFAGISDNLTKSAEHDLEQLALGMKIPMSLVGVANNPEGLAKVNDKEFLRFINSVRVIAEEIIETQIFRPYLNSQSPKLDEKVEFIWELPGDDEKNERLTKIKEALSLFDISPELRAALEIEYATILGLDVVDLLPTPEQAREEADKEKEELKKQVDQAREEEETKIPQPEVPGAKKTANQSMLKEFIKKVNGEFCVFSHQTGKNFGCYKTKEEAEKRLAQIKGFKDSDKVNLTETDFSNMKLSQYVNLKEIAGFNYSDYLVKILRNLRTEKFEDLSAILESDLELGLLPKRDVEKLRIILKDGFKKNKTIREIERDIKNSINLKDRVQIQEDGTRKITLVASQRPINITRTETVRLANVGLRDMYQDNDITSFRFLAALDERTCPQCESLNGQVFLTKDGMSGINMAPIHSMCRCSIIGLVE